MDKIQFSADFQAFHLLCTPYGWQYEDELIEVAKTTKNELLMRKLMNFELEEVRMALASNPNAPREILVEFLTRRIGNIPALRNMHSRGLLEEAMIMEMLYDFHGQKYHFWDCHFKEILTEFKFSEESLKKIILGYRGGERESQTTRSYCHYIASREDLSQEILGMLYKHPCYQVRGISACNPLSPKWVEEKFSESKEYRLRVVIAEHTSREDILDKLSQDESYSVRIQVAKNPHTPLYSLDRLVSDESEDVRDYLATNPKISSSTLLDLLHRSSTGSFRTRRIVRFVLLNPSLDDLVIEEIVKMHPWHESPNQYGFLFRDLPITAEKMYNIMVAVRGKENCFLY